MVLRIAVSTDPRQPGMSLKEALGKFWRYRVGDYRVLCEIRDDELVILAATIGHRREVYDCSPPNAFFSLREFHGVVHWWDSFTCHFWCNF